jgi:hypothetical protein
MLTVNPLFVLNSSLQLLFAVFWLQGWTTILGMCMQAKWMQFRVAPLELIRRGIGIFRLRFFSLSDCHKIKKKSSSLRGRKSKAPRKATGT